MRSGRGTPGHGAELRSAIKDARAYGVNNTNGRTYASPNKTSARATPASQHDWDVSDVLPARYSSYIEDNYSFEVVVTVTGAATVAITAVTAAVVIGAAALLATVCIAFIIASVTSIFNAAAT